MEESLNHLKDLQDRSRRYLHGYALDGTHAISNYGKRLDSILDRDDIDDDAKDGYIISILNDIQQESLRICKNIASIKAEYEAYRYAYDIIQDAMNREMRR